MRKKIKLYFTDFWATFNKNDNLFLNLISEKFDVEINEEDPDILIYSCYGWEYLKYDCIRIYYTPENKKTDFSACDFSISFEFLNKPNHYRLPFYAYRILEGNLLEKLKTNLTRDQATKLWYEKGKFCSMVVSNSKAKFRLNFYRKLNNIKKVDSGGTILNNIGGRVHDKMKFIDNYKFNLVFENESYPGYLTEKLVDALVVNSIPLYWGDPLVNEDFNPNRFINLNEFTSEQLLIDKVLKLEKDKEAYISVLLEPVFRNNLIPSVLDRNKLDNFLWSSIENGLKKKPIAKTYYKYFHFYNILKYKSEKKIRQITKRINP